LGEELGFRRKLTIPFPVEVAIPGQGLPVRFAGDRLSVAPAGDRKGTPLPACVFFLFSLSNFSRNENEKKQRIIFSRKPYIPQHLRVGAKHPQVLAEYHLHLRLFRKMNMLLMNGS